MSHGQEVRIDDQIIDPSKASVSFNAPRSSPGRSGTRWGVAVQGQGPSNMKALLNTIVSASLAYVITAICSNLEIAEPRG